MAPPTIGFRLLDDGERVALGKAAAKEGVTPHELARRFVIAALNESQEEPGIPEALGEVYEEVRELRKDVALFAEVLFVTLNGDSPEKVHAWVKENLLRE